MMAGPEHADQRLQDAFARIKALTHEVGKLTEELRRESRRRERASEEAREALEVQAAAMKRIAELDYTTARLSQDAEEAQAIARTAIERAGHNVSLLREGLTSLEAGVADRTKQSQKLLANTMGLLSRLRQHVSGGGGLGGGSRQQQQRKSVPGAMGEAGSSSSTVALHLLNDVTRSLFRLSGVITGHDYGASTAEAVPDSVLAAMVAKFGPQWADEVEAAAEGEASSGALVAALQQQVSQLQAALAAAQASRAGGEADLRHLLSEYQTDACDLRASNLSLTSRLQAVEADRDRLAAEASALRGQLKLSAVAALSASRQQDAASQSIVADLGSQCRQLEEKVAALQKQVVQSDVGLAALRMELAAAAEAVAAKDAALNDAHGRINRLQQSLAEQQTDIRAGLDLLVAQRGPAAAAAAAAADAAAAPRMHGDQHQPATPPPPPLTAVAAAAVRGQRRPGFAGVPSGRDLLLATLLGQMEPSAAGEVEEEEGMKRMAAAALPRGGGSSNHGNNHRPRPATRSAYQHLFTRSAPPAAPPGVAQWHAGPGVSVSPPRVQRSPRPAPANPFASPLKSAAGGVRVAAAISPPRVAYLAKQPPRLAARTTMAQPAAAAPPSASPPRPWLPPGTMRETHNALAAGTDPSQQQQHQQPEFVEVYGSMATGARGSPQRLTTAAALARARAVAARGRPESASGAYYTQPPSHHHFVPISPAQAGGIAAQLRATSPPPPQRTQAAPAAAAASGLGAGGGGVHQRQLPRQDVSCALEALRQDMAALDAEMAELEGDLRRASDSGGGAGSGRGALLHMFDDY